MAQGALLLGYQLMVTLPGQRTYSRRVSRPSELARVSVTVRFVQTFSGTICIAWPSWAAIAQSPRCSTAVSKTEIPIY